jgi:pyruvate dehydrogenase E2 component (dihydrolipoamide acetyltransferase)
VAQILNVPDSLGAEEAVLTEWLAGEGERCDGPVALVETAKAMVEVTAPADLFVLRHLVSPGSSLTAGSPLAIIGAEGETGFESLLDTLSSGAAVPPETSDPGDPTQEVSGPTLPDPGGVKAERIFASPLARRLATACGIDLQTLQGSGPGGRIRRDDVLRASAAAEPAHQATRTPSREAEASEAAAATEVEVIPHSVRRRAIANAMTHSKASVPHFYLRDVARMDLLIALRRELNEVSDISVTVTDFLVKAIAAAHLAVPEMNVQWSEAGVHRFSSVDVGLAIATDRGLVAPVMRGVDRCSLTQVARLRSALVERARVGNLHPDELEGGSATLSNLGAMGIQGFDAIINPPQASILAVGAVRDEPAVIDGELRVQPQMHLTLSVDHRPVDGAIAARWLRTFVDLIERPMGLLL